MSAASSAPPVQLCLQLITRSPRGMRRARSAQRAYWDSVDLADLGGDLRARNQHTRVVLGASQRPDQTWLGYFDVLSGDDGVSGLTKPQLTRQDALASAAYCVSQHCRSTIGHPAAHCRHSVRAAREVLRWMTNLDLL
jgi:hypothetical protein